MLGTRGIRIAFLYPQIYEMQIRALIGAAAEAANAGDSPHVEIMIPLVAYETELSLLRRRRRRRRRDEAGGRERCDVLGRHHDRAAARLPR